MRRALEPQHPGHEPGASRDCRCRHELRRIDRLPIDRPARGPPPAMIAAQEDFAWLATEAEVMPPCKIATEPAPHVILTCWLTALSCARRMPIAEQV